MATVLELVNSVLKNIDEQTIASLGVASGMSLRALDWVNETIHDIYSRSNQWAFREATRTITTTAGTDTYALDATVDPFTVRLLKERSTGEALRYLDYEEWYRNHAPLIADSSSGEVLAGRPTRYTIHSGNIVLWPSPDSTYTLDLYYFSRFIDYTTSQGASIPVIPTEYHHVIRRGATWLAKLFLGDEDAVREHQLYEQGIRKMLHNNRHYGDRFKGGRPELFRYDGDFLS